MTEILSESSLNGNRFLIRRTELTTEKLFVEYYLPAYQALLEHLRQSPYPLRPLGQISKRLFDGPFGSDRKVDMYQESGIPYIRVKDVLPGEIERSGLTFISEEKHEALSRSRVVPGNVLLTIAGRVGTAAVFPSDLGEGNITGHIVGIELPEEINPHYLALFLNSRFGEFQVTRLAHRTTRPELNLREISQILITLPPRPVQDRIAQIMQKAYATRQAKLAEAQALLDGIEDYVFRELNINPKASLEQKRFVKRASEIHGYRIDVEFNMGFHKFDSAKELVRLVRKVALFPVATRDPALEPEVPFRYIDIASIDVQSGEIVDEKEIVGRDAPSRARQVVRSGDIIVSTVRPTRGAIAIIGDSMDNFICSTGFAVIRANREILPDYLYIALRLSTSREQLGRRSSGSSYPAVLVKDIKEILIPVPDKDVQGNIVAEVKMRKAVASQLNNEAQAVVTQAKQQVEHLILGEESA